MDINKYIKQCESEIDSINRRIQWIQDHREALEKVTSDAFGFLGYMFDFDRMTHPEIVQIIRSFGGKWKKTPSAVANRIDYQTEVDGVTVRCWAGEAPPNCKIVEVEEDVPAVPAGKRKVQKLVCREPEPVEA